MSRKGAVQRRGTAFTLFFLKPFHLDTGLGLRNNIKRLVFREISPPEKEEHYEKNAMQRLRLRV